MPEVVVGDLLALTDVWRYPSPMIVVGAGSWRSGHSRRDWARPRPAKKGSGGVLVLRLQADGPRDGLDPQQRAERDVAIVQALAKDLDLATLGTAAAPPVGPGSQLGSDGVYRSERGWRIQGERDPLVTVATGKMARFDKVLDDYLATRQQRAKESQARKEQEAALDAINDRLRAFLEPGDSRTRAVMGTIYLRRRQAEHLLSILPSPPREIAGEAEDV